MGLNTVIGALFQEGTSQVIPSYFNGQHFSHWKARMETYTMSYDIKVWRAIKKGNLPIPPRKDKDGEIKVSSGPLNLDDYTKEQTSIVQVNAKAKNLLYNAINGEEYEKISSCETAKEMLDKIEVIYEGTNKVKETRINLLVHEYELSQIKERESIEEMFSRFRKIIGDLKSFGRPLKTGEQVRKILRSVPTTWQPTSLPWNVKILITHVPEKKENISFKVTVVEFENEEEEEGGEQDENIAMLSIVVSNMMKKIRGGIKGKKFARKGRPHNENDIRYYECGKFVYIQAECPELKREINKGFQKKKSFGACSDEEGSESEEITNICFMAIRESDDDLLENEQDED
ncbi:uncharacterized protein LOC142180957 [Nicotiana tabacum]|uniref:Uncharacterized protein LOC142180957 n=1 Tax=Nicotiana tabacum TaxID=4097 RepID=A0AC58UI42_TOBAC